MKHNDMSKILLFLATLLAACTSDPDPQAIVDAVINRHGGELYRAAMVDFDFRGRHYTAQRNGDVFIYRRTQVDSSGRIDDLMGNDFFFRCIDDVGVTLTPSEISRYSNSLNSVMYFALLPSPLNDPAVQKKYLGETTVKGEPYNMIEVTFREDGGGKDFEDRYVYWMHRERNHLDYLAYSFHVDGGGTRFREAYNARFVNGLRFVDYHNYKGPAADTELTELAKLFENGSLEKVSEIVLENVQVVSLR